MSLKKEVLGPHSSEVYCHYTSILSLQPTSRSHSVVGYIRKEGLYSPIKYLFKDDLLSHSFTNYYRLLENFKQTNILLRNELHQSKVVMLFSQNKLVYVVIWSVKQHGSRRSYLPAKTPAISAINPRPPLSSGGGKIKPVERLYPKYLGMFSQIWFRERLFLTKSPTPLTWSGDLPQPLA